MSADVVEVPGAALVEGAAERDVAVGVERASWMVVAGPGRGALEVRPAGMEGAGDGAGAGVGVGGSTALPKSDQFIVEPSVDTWETSSSSKKEGVPDRGKVMSWPPLWPPLVDGCSSSFE